MLTRQLATLVGAGIPLFESLNALIEQIENEQLKRALTQVREQVREGISFAKALEAHPTIFPPLYVNMVRAGEASGTLQQVLERLTQFMESQAKLKGKVTVGARLPHPDGDHRHDAGLDPDGRGRAQRDHDLRLDGPGAALVHGAAHRASATSWRATGGSLLSTLGAQHLRLPPLAAHRRRASCSWDSFMLKVPIFGKVVLMLSIARFARTLSTLLASGVALLTAMDIVSNVLGNAALEKVVVEAIGVDPRGPEHRRAAASAAASSRRS